MEALAHNEVEQEWSPAIPARFIAQVIEKLKDGRYPTEEVRCFCGADFNDTVIVERDRYGIPHRMVMCNECALIRANPRMTKEAYFEFYNTEYRPIYDGWQFGKDGESDNKIFMQQAEGGLSFKEFLDYFGVKPKTVIDIGSNRGGLLLPFMEEGVQVYGVEFYERGADYANKQGIKVVRSISELAQLGIKADLIVLNDVIEHYLDLNELTQIDQILAPNGVIFIHTPGLFRSKLNLLFQNAHTYQFIGETLMYVMDKLGFDPLFLDERIDSIWIRPEVMTYKIKKPANWIPFIKEHLEQKEKRTLPPLRSINKFSYNERWQIMDEVLSFKYPNIAPLRGTYSGSLAILGGGPSIDSEIDNIKALQASGTKLIAIDRMYPWCKKQGITPDFVTALDGCTDVAEGFTDIQPGVIHLIGTSTHPDAAKLLKGHQVYIYSGNNPHINVQDLWHKHGYEKITMINTGGSVVLAAMTLGMTLGFRDIHFFGFDCKVVKTDYANGIAGKGVERKYFEAELENGKKVYTCTSFLSFARQFFYLAETGRKSGLLDSVEVHGDSLVNDLFDWSKIGKEQWQTIQPAIPS